jgi:ADP-L-glycero-D-manno-heptose 6-epimerase
MNKDVTILVTGAAGFIGSCMVQYLNEHGYNKIILVDDFGPEDKRVNWEKKSYTAVVERQQLFEWLELHRPELAAFIHLGARTDTTEFNYAIHEELNVKFSQQAWQYCTANRIPLIYASSAATYGAGELGYKDDHAVVDQLQPLNPYGISKNEFDKWALQQSAEGHTPAGWTGLKFFNVYGPNEYHKGRMASVIWHSFNQINKDGEVKLFRSHRPDFKDGEQLRDFIYVKDVVAVIGWMMEQMLAGEWKDSLNGLYNLGTGMARSFADLAKATFTGMGLQPNIRFIDMPEDIRDKYQYFTEADMSKLHNAGYDQPFYSLEDGVVDYVRNYLIGLKHY